MSAGVAIALLAPGGIESLHQGAMTYLNREGMSWFLSDRSLEMRPQAAVQDYLARLKAAGIDPQAQGLWFQSDWRLLAAHQGQLALSSASLTKVGTSLAALEAWGPNHTFVTEVWADGPIAGGELQGNLIVRGGGDPMFVWEEAIALGNTLNQLGIDRVAGDLVIDGRFEMNFLPDPEDATPHGPDLGGTLLRVGINRAAWPGVVKRQHQSMAPGTPEPQVTIAGTVRTGQATDPRASRTLLIRHRSLPLLALLKQMNLHSNNFMAETLVRQLGGGAQMSQRLRALTGLPATELQALNGSGLGQGNEFSPRAMSVIAMTLNRRLQALGVPGGIAAILPMAGRDQGTIAHRKMPAGAAVKTGSLSEVSALSGFLPTRDRGRVWFAIINRSTKVNTLRAEQDRLLTTLQAQWGGPPPDVTPVPAIEPILGDPARNELVRSAPAP